MSNETFVTLVGSVHGEPEARFTPSGAAVVNFVVRTNARKFNKQTNEWERQPGKFWRCNAWNQGKAELATNIADTLKDKDNVVVYGELVTREYEKDGQKRTADELRVEAIGKDLRWHTNAATNGAQNVANGLGGQPVGGNTGGGWGAPAEDPWGAPAGNSPAF